MTSGSHTARPSSRLSMLVAALIPVVGVQFFILYLTAPLVGDDAMYTAIMGASTGDGGASIHGSLSEVWRGWAYDGRLSNCLACIMLLLPRWLSASLFSLLLIATTLGALRLVSPERFRCAGVVWMLFATTFFVGWFDHLFLIDLSCNYLVPAALTVVYCWLFFSPRSGWLMMTGAMAIGVLCGLMQQISFGPLLGASAVVIALQGRSTTTRQWLMTACLLSGLLPLLHPKMLTRVEGGVPFFLTTLLRNAVIFSLLFLWTGCVIFRAWKDRAAEAVRSRLRNLLASPSGMFLTASWIILVISLVWGTGARMAMGVTIFSAAGLASYFSWGAGRVRKWVIGLMAALTVAHLGYADLLSIRLIKEFRTALIAMGQPGVQQVFYELPPGNRLLTLGKVISPTDIHHSGAHYWPLYCSLPLAYPGPPRVMIPAELRDVDPAEITPIPGTAGIGRYRGYLVSSEPLPGGEYSFGVGPFTQSSRIYCFPFLTDRSRRMYLVDLEAASSLTLIFDINRIDKP